MKKCPECGTENPEDAEFCKKCGNKLEVSTQNINGIPKEKTEEESKAEKQDKYNKIAGIVIIVSLFIAVVQIMVAEEEEEKVSATLEVSAEEWESSGDRYVSLDVYVKNNTDNQVEIQELRYFTKLLIWGDPIARKYPDTSKIDPGSKKLVGELTIHEQSYQSKGVPRKVKVITSVGKFWTNVVEDYSYELK